MSETKYLPYGISDFKKVITGGFYYVDKTKFIPDLEDEAHFIFLTRPRRFGKTLWLSMLSSYYDCLEKDSFDELFGSLWIGSHKTAQQGKYLMLILDFSQVSGDIESLKSNFEEYMCLSLDQFMDRYKHLFTSENVDRFREAKTSSAKLIILRGAAKDLNLPLFLIVDEYDNFTNVVLNENGEEFYNAITHADGFYRDTFKKFKGMFDRIILVGVSPVTLDDLTSGYNIGWNITTVSSFNQILGFSEEEVRDIFEYYKDAGKLPPTFDTDRAIEEIKPWYDGYCFSQDALATQSKVFNSDMVLYYIHTLVRRQRPPLDMVDHNANIDYNKLQTLIRLDTIDGNRKSVLESIIERGEIRAEIEESFSAKSLTKPEMFTSLLFYYGMLTITGYDDPDLILGIPNNNIRKLYYRYLVDSFSSDSKIDISQLRGHFAAMAKEGEWRGCLQYLAEAYARVSSVRYGIEGERNIQGFFMAYLALSNHYVLAPELELSHGYCDFFLLPDTSRTRTTRHSYIIELKYLPKKDWADKAADQWKEAVAQIERYAAAPRVEALRQGTELHKVVVQFCGWEVKRMEAV